jgi:hypothetical protein
LTIERRSAGGCFFLNRQSSIDNVSAQFLRQVLFEDVIDRERDDHLSGLAEEGVDLRVGYYELPALSFPATVRARREESQRISSNVR